MATRAKGRYRPRALEALERRVLFSTWTPTDAFAGDTHDQLLHLGVGWDVVLIDKSLPNDSTLARAMLPGGKVIRFDGRKESATQVLNRVVDWAEETGSEVKTLSLLAHASAGTFALGNDWISNSTFNRTAAAWADLGAVMTPDASINLFGCSLAAPSSDGQALINRVANTVGANVFASNNLTGRGGDWVLEAASNPISGAEPSGGPTLPFNVNSLVKWRGTLATPATDGLLLTTIENVTGSNAPGLSSWSADDVLQFGNPNFAMGQGTTNGTFSRLGSLDTFAADGSAIVDGIAYVGETTVVGSGAHTVTLQAGDYLLSTATAETLTSSNSLSVQPGDIFGFRPSGGGFSGTFFGVLDGSALTSGNTTDFALVQRATSVGGVSLPAGSFVFSETGSSRGLNVYKFAPSSAGAGYSAGTTSLLIDGASLGFDYDVDSLEIVTRNSTIGGVAVSAGQLVLGLNHSDTSIGGNGIAIQSRDLFELNVSSAGASTAATATIIFQGANVGLTQTTEDVTALAFLETNNAPSIAAPATQSVNEDSVATFSSGGGNAIVLFDADAGNDPISATVTSTNGVLSLSGTSGLTFLQGDGTADATMTFVGTIDDINSALSGAQYVPNSNFNGSSTVSISVNDQGNYGAGGAQSANASVTVTVNAVNDAPVLSGGNSFTATNENDTNSGGTLVSDLIAGRVSDVDSGAVAGIAVTGVVNTNGTWQYTTDNGSSWTAFGSPSATSARLLTADANTRIRFVPNANYHGTVANGVTFRAWDQTSGTAGNTANVSTNGGATAYSTATASSSITVNAVNTAPVANDDTYSVNEDTTLIVNPQGTNLADHFAFDEGAVQTVADTGATGANGTLGATTATESTDPTRTAGHLGSGALSFDGSDDYVSTTSTVAKTAPSFTLSTWFQTNSTSSQHHLLWEGYGGGDGNGNPSGDATTSEMNLSVGSYSAGNKIAFFLGYDVPANGADPIYIVSSSDFTDTTRWHHVAVVVTDQGGGVSQGALYVDGVLEGTDTGVQNNRSNWGALQIGKPGANTRYFSGQIDDVRVYDAALASGAVQNLARGGVLTNDSDADGDLTELVPSSVTGPSHGTLAIEADGSFHYTPNADFNGTDTFTYQNSDGTANSNVATVTITVNAVNDAPVLSGANSFTAISEDDGGNSGTLVSSLVSGYVTDVDSGALSGIAVTGADTTNGVWQFSTNGGSSWNTLGTVSTSTARLLRADALTHVRFVPNANFNGVVNPGITFVAWDQTSGVAGSTGDTTSNGGTTAYSAASSSSSITVNAVNDAPVNAVPGPQTINEDTSLVFSTANGNAVSIADPDAGSAAVRVVIGVTNGTLTLSGTTGLTFSVGDGIADGTMTFTGTMADINASLNGLTYDPNANYNGSETLSISTNDQGNSGAGGALSDNDSVSITVNPVNDAPQVTTTGTVLAYTENGSPIAIDSAASVSDIDSTNLSGATVVITANYSAGQDVLSFTNQAGITGTWNSGTATLTLSGSASVAAYQAALRSVAYANSSDNPSTLTRTIAFRVSDGSLFSSPATRDASVTAVNDPPTLNAPTSSSTNEDTALVFSTANGNAIVLGDADAGTNAVQLSLDVTNGTLTLASTAGLTFVTGDGVGDATMTFTGTVGAINSALDGAAYTPAADYNGPATLSVNADDLGSSGTGGHQTSSTSVAISVVSTNDAPVLSGTANLPGIDEDDTGNSGSLISNLLAGHVNDADAGDGSGIAVTSADNANGSWEFSTNGGTTWTAISSVSNSSALLLASNATTRVRFVPSLNFNGVVSGLTFRAWDQTSGVAGSTANTTTNGGGSSFSASTATASITVAAVNDPPTVSVPGAATTNEDTGLTFSIANGNSISVADPDAGSGLRLTLSAAHGTLTLAGTAGLTFIAGDGTADATMTFTGTVSAINNALNGLAYSPAANYNGSDIISVNANDQGYTGAGGALSASASINVTINAVNDAPVLTGAHAFPAIDEDDTTSAGATVASLIAGKVTDADAGDPSGVAIVSAASSNGVWQYSTDAGASWSAITGVSNTSALLLAADAGTRVRFVPNTNYNGTVSGLTIRAWDQSVGTAGSRVDATSNGGATALSAAIATASIVVNSVNDAPVAADESYTTSEDTTLIVPAAAGVLSNDSDVDNDPLTAGVVTGPSHGSLALAADGSLTYTPDANYNGPDFFTYRANDGTVDSNIASVSLAVTSVNDAPSAVDDAYSTAEDTVLTADAASGVLANDSDVDGDAITANLLSGPTHGTLQLSSDGSFEYSPDADYNGADAFTYAADDGNGSSTVATVNLSVSAVNDDPVTTAPPNQAGVEDTAVVFSAANGNSIRISDVDLLSGSLLVTLRATRGSVTLAGFNGLTLNIGSGTDDTIVQFAGNITDVNAAMDGLSFRPTLNANGAANLRVTVSDQGNTGAGGPRTTVQDIAIDLSPTNDAPVAADDSYATDEDTVVAVDPASGVLANDTDVDGDALNAVVVDPPQHGKVTLNTDGSFRYTPDQDFNGTDAFTYRAADGIDTSADATVNLTIAAVNDAPKETGPLAVVGSADVPIVFSSLNGTAISISDVDLNGGEVLVSVRAARGTISLSKTDGLTFQIGSGDRDVVAQFSGLMTDVNAALDGLTFTPRAGYNGLAGIRVVTSDQGQSGAGGPKMTMLDMLIDLTPRHRQNDALSPTDFGSADGSTTSNNDLLFSDSDDTDTHTDHDTKAHSSTTTVGPPPRVTPQQRPILPREENVVSAGLASAHRTDRSKGNEEASRPLPRMETSTIVAKPLEALDRSGGPMGAPAIERSMLSSTSAFARQLEKLTQDLANSSDLGSLTVGSTSIATAVGTAGYVVWCIRSGSLVAAMLQSLPLWRWFDPIPVIEDHEQTSSVRRKTRRRGKSEVIAPDADEERMRHMLDGLQKPGVRTMDDRLSVAGSDGRMKK